MEIEMRYPNGQSKAMLLNLEINKACYYEELEEGVGDTLNEQTEEENPSTGDQMLTQEQALLQQISERVQQTQLMEESLVQQFVSRMKQEFGPKNLKERENPIVHEFSGNSENAPKAYEASWSAESGVKGSNTQMYNADNELSQDSIRKLQQMGTWYNGNLNNSNIDKEYQHWRVIEENMPLKKEAQVSYSNTTQPTHGAIGFKIPHISAESIKKLKAMDDWYKGSLNDSEISEHFQSWWYFLTITLKLYKKNLILAG